MDRWIGGRTDRWTGGWMETEILLRSLGFLDRLTNKSVLYSISSEVEEFPKALEE